MKYPTEIDVRGYKYRIEYVKDPREVDRDFESPNYLGSCSPHVIRLLAGQTSLALIETFAHEVLHAIFTRNPMLKQALQEDMEEVFISTLGAEISQILLNNEWINFSEEMPITTRIVPEDKQD